MSHDSSTAPEDEEEEEEAVTLLSSCFFVNFHRLDRQTLVQRSQRMLDINTQTHTFHVAEGDE